MVVVCSTSTVFPGAMMAVVVPPASLAAGPKDHFIPPPDSSSSGSKGGGFVSGGRHKILIVDDERMVRNALCRALGRALQLAPENILQAVDVASGIQVFDGERDLIQGVFTDMMMPGRLGLEIYFHVREYSELTPVIFMSGGMPNDVNKEMDRILARDSHAKFYQKPSLPGSEIVPWIRDIWGDGQDLT